MKIRYHVLAGLTASLVFATLPGAHASSELGGLTFVKGSGVSMKLTNIYDDLPPYGFLPVQLEVTNDSGSARQWEMFSRHTLGGERTFQSSERFSVPAKASRTFEFLIPLAAPEPDSHGYSNLFLSMRGYGVQSGEVTEYSSGTGRTPTPYTGMGNELAVKHWAALRELFEKTKKEALVGSMIDISLLSSDWRGLSGFDVLIFTGAEWRALTAGRREAVLDWINTGGSLLILHPEESVPADLPAEGGLGAGRIQVAAMKPDIPGQVRAFLKSSPSTKSLLWDYTWTWPLAEKIGRPSPPQVFIIAFVLVFAVIIGPVNFLVFAPAGNRQRLFWTTPLISLAASVLMGGGIAMSEGFGGDGKRMVLVLNRPEARRSVQWQEQISRTGVLVSNAFAMDRPVFLLPVDLKKAGSSSPNRGSFASYSLFGNRYSGDWFQSRKTQTQALVSIQESRERIEISQSPDAPPVVQSTFSTPLEEFWYFDQAGSAWKTARLQPGQKLALSPANVTDFEPWWKAQLQPAGPLITSRAENFRKPGNQNKFFARLTAPALPTLTSIRWGGDAGLVMGTPLK